MSRRALVTILAFFAFVSLGLPDGLLGVTWPSMSAAFGAPLDALGLVVSVTVAGYLLSSFSSGAVLRVLPIGTVLALSTGAAAVALLMFGIAPVWPMVILAAFLAGLGGGAIDAGLNAYGASHFSARTLNWLHASFGLGTTAGPLIATSVLSADLVWRWSYLLVGTAQAVLAVTFLLTRQRWGPDGRDGPDPAAPARSLETLRRPVVWLGMAVFFLYAGAEVATALWAYSVMTIGRGVGDATAGLSVAAYWGSLMAGRILFGLVADRVPLVPALRVAIGVSALGALLFWLGASWWVWLLGLVLLGLGFAPVFASLISLTPSRVGRAHAASAIGFQVAGAALGGAIVTAAVGVIAGAAGLEVVGMALFGLVVVLFGAYEGFVRS